MSEVSTDKKLKGKDLITIGIFSAIYFVINFAFMLLGGIHPVLWMLMPGFIAAFAGIPFMLMVAKVQKLGAVFLMGLITALIYFVTGQFTLVILISMASTCILAEVVRAVTKYNSFKGNSIAYVIFSLGMVGSPLPIWLFKADFLAQITEQGMPADYVAAVEALSSNAMLIVLFVAPIIGGIIGGIVAAKGGLRKWLWPMAWSISLTCATFVYLSYYQPDSLFIINLCVFIEQFGYGFGFTAYMLYLIYFSDGEHKTAHYAICTAFMALGMMLPGMAAGWLQELIGYKHFFYWVMICCAATIAVCAFIKIDPNYGKKDANENETVTK